MSGGRVAAAFRWAARLTGRVESALLAVLVTAMVLLAALQILLRNLFHAGWPWVEPVLGMGLLWMTMLGALAASGKGRHLAIDLAGALFPRAARVRVGRAISLFAVAVCAELAKAAWRFVGIQLEMNLGGELLGLPTSYYYYVVPAAFALMAARFLVRAAVPSAWLADGEGAS